MGAHEKPDLSEAFHERLTREFGGNPENLPYFKKLNLGLARCNFPLFEGLTCILQSLDSRYFTNYVVNSSLPHHTLFLRKFGQITRPIFQKVWSTYPRGSASVSYVLMY